jgi:hypothetical protein
VFFDVGCVFVFIPLKPHYSSVAQTCTQCRGFSCR